MAKNGFVHAGQRHVVDRRVVRSNEAFSGGRAAREKRSGDATLSLKKDVGRGVLSRSPRPQLVRALAKRRGTLSPAPAATYALSAAELDTIQRIARAAARDGTRKAHAKAARKVEALLGVR